MHLTPGVVHNFPKAVGVYDFCPQIPIDGTCSTLPQYRFRDVALPAKGTKGGG